MNADDFRRARVTGAKTFASDYRPKDFGWGTMCQHALVLRSSRTDCVFRGFDVSRLPVATRPSRLVSADDIVAAAPADIQPALRKTIEEIFVPVGSRAKYRGQPIGLALFNDYQQFFAGAMELRANSAAELYGPIVDATLLPTLGQRLERWRKWDAPGFGGKPVQQHYLRRLSANRDALLFPTAREHFMDRDKPAVADSDRARVMLALSEALEASERAGKQIVHNAYTASVDPAFLEPECGIAWFDQANVTMHLAFGAQSIAGDRGRINRMLGNVGVEITPLPMGGSFGGRENSGFPELLAAAALVATGPVRLAHDRYEQFQSGLKRHACASRTALAYDADGTFRALQSHLVFEGGAIANLTASVMKLGTLHAAGPYAFELSAVHGAACEMRGPVAGSMRGFGIPQSCFNIEVLVDRVATQLDMDAIALRQKNLFVSHGEHHVANFDAGGAPLDFHVGIAEVLRLAAGDSLWRERDTLRSQKSSEHKRYGVGFACCAEAYGTSSDGACAIVHLSPAGKITVFTQVSEMGQGAAAAVENATCFGLGQPASHVRLSEDLVFEALRMRLEKEAGPGDFSTKVLSAQGTSASRTAFFHVHAIRQAVEALWRESLLPALCMLWNVSEESLANLAPEWKDGVLQVGDARPVTLADLATVIHKQGWSSAAMVHSYFKQGWVGASFKTVRGRSFDLYADGLATASIENPDQTDGWQRAERSELKTPPDGSHYRTLYAAGGHLVGVVVDTRSGEVRVSDVVSIIDAGTPLHLPSLEGQIEGGLAMGLSHALFESMPDHVGCTRALNFDTYRIARSENMPLTHKKYLVELDRSIVPGGPPHLRHKGVAEVTMTTVAPAIANAIAHALGHSFWPSTLPIRPQHILSRQGERNA
ncbi:xanthine dehydrogenase family protein molybdopterin-binding subunit [Massilia sp. IC2-476]|uniref:xanthine dehydrogenase family protein molybdopterin-binding subunit n=1 Tax=Massilia sp. IC2-476 TaxID=2887199 RepID=UPI001D126DDD|nr:molybdopterin cofactor-binding domain-containing protein [Massilia sp. IC2-476]MCC2973578.1 molybdopterin-dependent oxidoreductase [Massilia sp. IC2-476]